MWLREQRDRDDVIGEVARVVTRDACLAGTDYDTIRHHRRYEHHSSSDALQLLEAANEEHLSASSA